MGDGKRTDAMQTIRLGDAAVWPDQHRLEVHGRSIHLEPKVMAVLVLLMEHAGEVVTRQALMDTVWAGRVVGEEALTRCISELRSALGDRAVDPRYIQTVPKRGYRLLETPSVSPAVPRRRILATAAAALLLILGSATLWLARAPADSLSAARARVDIAAPDLYLLGRHHWHERTPEGLERAVAYFQQAIAADPDLVAAYSGLADAYLLQASYDDRTADSAMALAAPLIEQALALDPDSPDAHASRGILLQRQGDFSGAEAALARAVQLDPGHAMAHMWRGNATLALGRLRDAFDHYATAYALDPRHPAVTQNYLTTLIELGDYQSVRSILRARAESDRAAVRLGAELSLQAGDWDEALRLADLMTDDPVGASLLRWRLEVRRQNLSAAESHLAVASRAAPGDERVYLATLEHQAQTPGAMHFPRVEQLWQERQEVPAKIALMARAWNAIAGVGSGEFQAATSELAALIGEFDTSYPPFRMKLLGHLLIALEGSGQTEAYDRWKRDALALVGELTGSGWASFEFQVERGFLLAAAGEMAAAAASFRDAGTLGDISSLRLADDPRIPDQDASALLEDVI